MTRRTFVHGMAAVSAAGATNTFLMGDSLPHYKIGIATTSYMGVWRPKDTYEFLERCHSLGAAGIQSAINGDIPKIRSQAERWGMYVEAMVPMPHGNDSTAFEKSLKDAQQVGAIALRSACLGTRRYETFHSLDAWRQHVAESERSVSAAVPLLEKYKIPLGLENHKDWIDDELVALLRKHSSEYLGACLDFGNNIALLDQPMDVIEKLAPYTVCTHLKNMAVEPFDDGFLLSEVVLGDGYLDLKRAVSLVRQHWPKANFSLEMITRDPLKVPCLTDGYWVTFPDRNGLYLARTLKFVDTHKSAKPLPRENTLAREQQNVIDCLNYAREELGL
ncbi:MAG TPA: TIM barrel protein [Bryobacteraceae bacterium]|jgi:sugar phosphate isomerase/epimerase